MSRARDFAGLAQSIPNIALSSEVATSAQGALASTAIQPNTSTTLNELLTTNYKNTVYTLVGTQVDPANGNVQVKSFGSSNITLTENLESGESVVLILVGTGSVTFPSIVWKGGEVPSLETTGSNIVVLIKQGTTLFGSFAGVFN